MQQVAAQEDRAPFVARQSPDQRPHLPDAGDVQPVGGLVQDHQLRIVEQSGGDAQPLLHAGGEALNPLVHGAAETDLIEQGVGASGVSSPDHGAQHRQVLASGEEGIEGPAIDQRAHAGQLSRMGGDVLAPQARLPPARPDQAQQHADGRALARPVGTEEAVDLAPTDGQANALDRRLASETLGEVHQFEDRVGV